MFWSSVSDSAQIQQDQNTNFLLVPIKSQWLFQPWFCTKACLGVWMIDHSVGNLLTACWEIRAWRLPDSESLLWYLGSVALLAVWTCRFAQIHGSARWSNNLISHSKHKMNVVGGRLSWQASHKQFRLTFPRPRPLELNREDGKERWMAWQIYCRVTGSKDIISSGGEIALLDRTDSMEKNVCMPGAKYESVNEKFPFSLMSSLTCAKEKIYCMCYCYCYCTFGAWWQKQML